MIETFSKSNRNSHDAWRLFSKAKHALEDGARLENLSWRLFHMKVSYCNSSTRRKRKRQI
jgi:arginine decarboxylase-like protein